MDATASNTASVSDETSDATAATGGGDTITLVYQYGLLPPREGAEIVRDQMRMAHKYRNELVQIARKQRAAERALVDPVPAVREAADAAVAATAAVAAAHSAIRAEHVEQRTRKHGEELQLALDEARERSRAAYKALDTARRKVMRDKAVRVEIERIRDIAHEEQINARANCGCCWGTYQLVEAAMDASLKLVLAPGKSISLPLWDGVEPRDPRFQRWDGSGEVSIHIQNRIARMSDAATDTFWRIEARDEEYTVKQTGERRTRTRHTLALRVGSNGRAPVWARWPLVMHRPLPEGALIKRITATVRAEGPHDRWTCEMTIQLPKPARVHRPELGAVSVDLGWRVIGDEIRVASWVDEHGEKGELRLSSDMLGGLRKASEIASVRADNFNRARAALRTHLSALPTLPDWLVERTRGLAQWQCAGRLALLARVWKTQRFDGDTTAYDALEQWRYHDYHLWEWETAQRTQGLNARRELYRRTAFALAKQYDTLVVEQFDLRRVAQRASVDTVADDNETARSNRHAVSPSELRSCLMNAFGRAGAIVEVSAVFSTQECHACGEVQDFDAAKNLRHTCVKCGSNWDQDENAARVLLSRWQRERSSGTSEAVIDRNAKHQQPKGSKWQRLKAAKAARAEEPAQDAETTNDSV